MGLDFTVQYMRVAGYAVLACGVDAVATTMYPQGAGFLLTAIHLKQEPVLVSC